MKRGNFLSTNQKHYQDLGGARHQYGISALELVTQTSFCEGSSGDLEKRRLFSQAISDVIYPTFEALNNEGLLSRCFHGGTQNQNEVVYGMIWQRATKKTHSSLPIVSCKCAKRTWNCPRNPLQECLH